MLPDSELALYMEATGRSATTPSGPNGIASPVAEATPESAVLRAALDLAALSRRPAAVLYAGTCRLLANAAWRALSDRGAAKPSDGLAVDTLWPALRLPARSVLERGLAVGPFRQGVPGGAGAALDLEILPLLDDGRTVGLLLQGSGPFAPIAAVPKDVETAVRAEAALIAHFPGIIWRASEIGGITWVSAKWTEYTGLGGEESLGRGWLAAIHPDDRAQFLSGAFGGHTEAFRLEFRIRRQSDGEYRWSCGDCVPLRDDSGRIVEWVGSVIDIDDLRRLKEAQGILVAELQHRTRNLVAVVRAIARQTAANASSPATFQAELCERLDALGRAQALLSRGQDLPITIRELVEVELYALGALASGGHVRLSGPRVALRPGAVQILALALHELATNARKYGTLGPRDGRLTVTWRLKTSSATGSWLQIVWRESGLVPIVPERERRGYGRELIEYALPYQLGARTAFELLPVGVRCRIELPMPEARA